MGVNRGAGRQNPEQFGLHLGIGQKGSPFFGHDDDIHGWQQLLVTPEKFPQQALDAVALRRRTHLAADRQTQTGGRPRRRGQADAEMPGVKLFPPGLGLEIFPPLAEPGFFREAGRPGRNRKGAGRWGLRGELGGPAQRNSSDLTKPGASGPGTGAAATPGGRLCCSCGLKTRGCGPSSVCWVERSVS